MRKNLFWKATVSVLAALVVTAAGCGGGEPDHAGDPDYAPIVPGYSLAGLDIDATFATAREAYGDPEVSEYRDGYIYSYFLRLNDTGKRDDPETWHLVVVFHDNGNFELDDADTIGQIEVSAPYYGTTSGGNSMESTPEELIGEFGQFDGSSETEYNGQAYIAYTFSKRGVEFLEAKKDGRVVTMVVTPIGGLKPATGMGKQYAVASGDIFKVTGTEPIVAGTSLAGISIGDNYVWVKDNYGLPNLTGFMGEGLVSATYTGGTGGWKLNVYLQDQDLDEKPSDYDTVISVAVRSPYAGKTAKGVGIGSKQADVSKEFGPAEILDEGNMGGESAIIWQYPSKGIVFAMDAATGLVVEVDVNKI